MTRRSAAVSVSLSLTLVALAAPTATAKVLVNEVFTGGTDYLELRNPSAIPVDLSGWTVRSWIASSIGPLTEEAPYTLPTGTVLKGDSLLVIQELGTVHQPGSLPKSISTGKNWLWTTFRTIEVALYDEVGRGVDYLYLNRHDNPIAPHLPAGLSWTGSIASGSGDQVMRFADYDTNDGYDWQQSSGGGSPGALNPGQVDCAVFKEYGDGCPGTGDHVPTLQSMSCPGPGGAVYFRIDEAVGGGHALLAFGRTGAQTPLPSGCLLRVGELYGVTPPLPLGGAGPGRGVTILAGYLPASLEKVGFTVQALVLDAGAPGGVAATNAARVFVQ